MGSAAVVLGKRQRPDVVPALRIGRNADDTSRRDVVTLIVLGLILLLIGALTGIAVLWTIGIVLIVVGAILWILGATGHQLGRRPHYF